MRMKASLHFNDPFENGLIPGFRERQITSAFRYELFLKVDTFGERLPRSPLAASCMCFPIECSVPQRGVSAH